jgi:hypothetical protein
MAAQECFYIFFLTDGESSYPKSAVSKFKANHEMMKKIKL